MQTVRCEAIVLGSSDYGEADRIVTLLSLEEGKIRGIAPHARKSRRRFGGALELFARLHLQVRVRDGLSVVTGADIVTLYHHIREDLQKIALASYACEVVDRLAAEGMCNPRLFRLLAAYLGHLDTSPPSASDRRFFEVNLLNILGYRLPLERCASCGAELAGETGLWYSSSAGGILCPPCGGTGRRVSPATLPLLKRSMQTGRFGAVTFAADELGEAGAMLDAAIAAHLGRPLKTLAFLQEIADAAGSR